MADLTGATGPTLVIVLSTDPARDVAELARAADPRAFEPHPIEARSHAAAVQWAVRRKIATDHAANILSYLVEQGRANGA